jgi:hypothetical protein
MSPDNYEPAKLPLADGEGLYTRGGVVQPFDLSKMRNWEVFVRSIQMVTATFSVLRCCYDSEAKTTSRCW